VIEDQLDSNRPIQGVKLNFDQLQLAARRAVAPRSAFAHRKDPPIHQRQVDTERSGAYKFGEGVNRCAGSIGAAGILWPVVASS
jgi:hypothetical protein